MELVTKLHASGKLPIIVGGTNYYIESLLWDFLIDDEKVAKGEQLNKLSANKRSSEEQEKDEHTPAKRQLGENRLPDELNRFYRTTDEITNHSKHHNSKDSSNNVSSHPTPATSHPDSLYAQLQAVDPERAATMHPNDVRKIERSLQIFQNTGIRHSQLLEMQNGIVGFFV